MEEVVAYLLANPLVLTPVLLIVAMFVVAVLKRLVKIALVLVVAGVLYVLLAEYVGTGM